MAGGVGWERGLLIPANEPSHAQRKRGDVSFVAFQAYKLIIVDILCDVTRLFA